MKEDFFKLITDGTIMLEYYEDEENDNEANIAVRILDENLEKAFTDDMYIELIDYVQDCLLVAAYAGFEAPTEFYKDIKKFIESGDPLAKH